LRSGQRPRSRDSLQESVDDAVAVGLRKTLLVPVAVHGPDPHSKQLVTKDVERQAVGTTRVLTVIGDDPRSEELRARGHALHEDSVAPHLPVLLHGERADPLAARVGNYKAVFNLRGDNGALTGGLAVDSNQGWKGPEKYVAMVPRVFDL